MKNFVRWYEKEAYLKAFMSELEGLSLNQQSEIAIDIILKASEYIDRDYTNLISEISSFDPKDYKRWYDKNPTLHLAIEIIRDLPSHERQLIINETIEKIDKIIGLKR